MSGGGPTSAMSEKGKIFLVVAFYFVVSMSLVFMNKFLMVSKEFEFPYPMLITWYQILIGVVCVVGLCSLKPSFPNHLSFLPTLVIKTESFRKISLLTLIYVVMLTTTNYCLKYVEVSFYQVARSLTICFNVLFTYTILKQSISQRSLLACGIVFVGYVMGGVGEINFTWLGLINGLISSVALCLYSIVFKKKLAEFDNNEWTMLFYNSTLSCIVMLPGLLLSGELQEAMEKPFIWNPVFWFNMTVTAIFGFMINLAMFLQIKYTSPLTNNISGTAKACVQTILSVFIFRNPISALNLSGTLLCIAGSAYYGHVKYQEMEEAKKELAQRNAQQQQQEQQQTKE